MPDVELKPQVYKDPRPKEYFDRSTSGCARASRSAVYEVVRVVTVLHALITFRARGLGTENVPNGPVILAPNHASFMDHFFTGAFIRRRVQFMAKSQMFKPGPLSWVYSHGGVFPVRRGHHDEEAFISAFEILGRGGAVVMYCEGGRSRTGQLADTAKPGIGRLALESGAPVVPLAILGSHQVRNWKRLHVPEGDDLSTASRSGSSAIERSDARAAAGGGGHHLRPDPDAARRARAARPEGRAAAEPRARDARRGPPPAAA